MYNIVIAHYEESLNWLYRSIPAWVCIPNLSIYVYHKGYYDGTTGQPPLTGLIGPSITHVKLPNIGREGDTFLYHLSQGKSGKTLFLQGSPLDHIMWHSGDLTRIDSDTGYLPEYIMGLFTYRQQPYEPVPATISCDRLGRPHHWEILLIDQAWNRIRGIAHKYGKSFSDLPDQIEFCAGAQMLIDLDKLRIDPMFWAEMDIWLLEDTRNGYILERLWKLIVENIIES